MSLEPGGRCDKLGNAYEDRYFASLMLRLIQEEIQSITVEKLGEYGDYAEYVVEQADGVHRFYQCKASNGTASSWSIAQLRGYNVFSRIKDLLSHNPNAEYWFISPLGYKELDELCNRARRNSSAQEWEKYQIKTDHIRAVFDKCAAEFGFDISNEKDLGRYCNFMSRCYFITYPFNDHEKETLNSQIHLLFSGDPEIIRPLLEGYAKTNDLLGKKITVDNVIAFLETHNIALRNVGKNKTIYQTLQTLNNTYYGRFHAIHDTLLHRTATDALISEIKLGHSVIVHGKAGMGKSGCLQELINYCRENQILYVAVKLDRNIPSENAIHFGQQLGLPDTLVSCMNDIAAGKDCVIILDQLDALRWSNIHSGDAISICKELISEAESLNRQNISHISLVFASRTFDLENDRNLRELFDVSNSKHSSTVWRKLEVGPFSEQEVLEIVGASYHNLSGRLKDLLHTPSSLYVWTKLDRKRNVNNIATAFDLMTEWWKEIEDQCTALGIQADAIDTCKAEIVSKMSTGGFLTLPRIIFVGRKRELDALISCGLLCTTEHPEKISFVHQSFLDYFLSVDLIRDIYSGKNLSDLLGNIDDQTPVVRYRLSGVLQQIMESDPSLFVAQVKNLLSSESVRFYMKCSVFEVMGQSSSPTGQMIALAQEYRGLPEWKDYVEFSVYLGHPAFITQYHPDSWIDESSLKFLRSVNYIIPDFVTEKLTPYAFVSADQDKRIFSALCNDIAEDSDAMFHLRMKLLSQTPNLMTRFFFFPELIQRNAVNRVILLFTFILAHSELHSFSHHYFGSEAETSAFIKKNYKEIFQSMFPTICTVSSELEQNISNLYVLFNREPWSKSEYNESVVRQIVDITIDAAKLYASKKPTDFAEFLNHIEIPLSAVGHEIILNAFQNVPAEYSDFVLNWLMEDFSNRIFCFTGSPEDYLLPAKQIISRLTISCSPPIFSNLEQYIMRWHESSEIMKKHLQWRIDVNHQKAYTPVYYPYWGNMQKELLSHLAPNRISTACKELISVLNRNEWITTPNFHYGVLSGKCGSISSPLDKKREKLSDQKWLQIISTPDAKLKGQWNYDTMEVSSHQQFASALGVQARAEPLRFAKLALRFPEKCNPAYVYHVFDAVKSNQTVNQPDHTLVEKLIVRYGESDDPNIATEIVRIIRDFADKSWSEPVLRVVQNIALYHPYPQNEVDSAIKDDDYTVNNVEFHSYNSTRGCAFQTITQLLWHHKDLFDYFKDCIAQGVDDPHAAVRFSVMSCVIPCYNIDPRFAVSISHQIIEKDIRAIAAHGYWQIIMREYTNNSQYYLQKLKEALISGVVDLGTKAAEYLCAIGIHFDDVAIEILKKALLTLHQKQAICEQAGLYFDDLQYNATSKKILELFLRDMDDTSFADLFANQKLKFPRDTEFLTKIMSLPLCNVSVFLFAHLIKNYQDMKPFVPFLKAIVYDKNAYDEKFSYYYEDFAKCINMIFDQSSDDKEIRHMCLDIWDGFFKNIAKDTLSIRTTQKLLNSF